MKQFVSSHKKEMIFNNNQLFISHSTSSLPMLFKLNKIFFQFNIWANQRKMVKWFSQVTKWQVWNLNPTLLSLSIFYFNTLHDTLKSSVFSKENVLGKIT